ncbi:MAG: NTP transferase domain-containing protein [Candidatus Krumholzibacteriota bacterium]|nr:NTP transferase domain-containing protein [Candidatus Krumholzibacteriota bacterium]
MKAVIIAAGTSSRLWSETDKTPKTLLPFGEGTILSSIMHNIAEAGIDEFVFILGFMAKQISDYLDRNDSFGFSTATIMNRDYLRGNGLSVLLAEQAVGSEDFILSMSDHIVTPRAIERVISDGRDKNLLLVDKRTGNIFDIDDATKVWLDGKRIERINKNLTEYNGIDCGIFRLTPRFFKTMRKQKKNGQESISAGIEILIQNGDMEAVFMNEDEKWIDIDTPDAYRFAQDSY